MDYLVSQNQFSPRAGAVYKLTSTTTLNAGYARYFQVPPFESVLLETATKFANTTGASPVLSGNQNIKAESDNFFDLGVNQMLPWQVNANIEGFFYLAKNKLDLLNSAALIFLHRLITRMAAAGALISVWLRIPRSFRPTSTSPMPWCRAKISLLAKFWPMIPRSWPISQTIGLRSMTIRCSLRLRG